LAAGFIGAAATAAYGGYYPYRTYAYPYPAYAHAAYPAYPVSPYYYARPYWRGYYGRPYWRARYYARPWGYRRMPASSQATASPSMTTERHHPLALGCVSANFARYRVLRSSGSMGPANAPSR
jgi:hypothetical protein